jgi:hypothetical protein
MILVGVCNLLYNNILLTYYATLWEHWCDI